MPLSLARFTDELARERAVAIVRAADAAAGRAAALAAVRGGFRLVEITLTTPAAYDTVAELAGMPGVVAGAGTVLTVEEAQRAVACGASFLVSPVTDAAVIAAAAELGAAAIPGAHTPTELYTAHRLGAPFQKLFPAPGTGPEYLRSVLAPLPMLRVVPTNGVTAGNAEEWIAAGAFAVGFARELFRPEDLAAAAWDRIAERAARLRAIVGAAPR